MTKFIAAAAKGTLAFLALPLAAAPALRVVRTAYPGVPLLANGSFERKDGEGLLGWRPGPKGYRATAGEGRQGSQALLCENSTGDGWFGASQTLALNRTSVAPLIVRGWSKAEGITGGTDSGYSLYVDILYADGTPLWGQTGNFRCGTHGWERREFVILPKQPVRSLTLHCLFRGHAGKAWFDEVSVEEVQAPGGAVMFQGVPVQPSPIEAIKPSPGGVKQRTHDGLELTLRDHAVTSLKAGGRELAAASPGGFLARDVASNSDVFGFERGACHELGLKLSAALTSASDHIAVQGRVTDTTARDRAITLLFAVPLEATGWRWGDDIRRKRLVGGSTEFINQVAVRCGATGTMSLYPLGAVWSDQAGVAVALDLAHPAQYRVGYQAGLRWLFIAFDFGLVQDTDNFPGSAAFRLVLYRFDPAWGFRAAFQKYMDIFPGHFTVRAKDQGLWMPFTDVSTVQGWEDFGFRFHEGNNNVPWDDEHGILSFRYTEPMTWWMAMKKGTPRTLPEALRIREEMAQGKNDHHRRMAEASRVAAMHDESGQPSLLFRDTPWCDGAVWSLNPNPFLGVTPARNPNVTNRPQAQPEPLNAATLHWNDAIKERLYSPSANGRLDGEYLDSLEGYVTADLNYRREHFCHTTVPLTFSTDTQRPALFKGLAVFEFTKWIANDVHRLGKLTFANGVPYRFTFLCPWLDVLGTETDWLRGDRYTPAAIVQMDLWRTMSGAKPYLLLMNTDYDKFTSDRVEQYFQRCLFYGMWPGFFSHNAADNPYWKNTTWYNRDRPLFKRFIPLVKRVAEAGWQAVTGAICDNNQILVERFGPDAAATVYLTLYNDTPEVQSGNLTPRLPQLFGPTGRRAIVELCSGKTLEPAGDGWKVSLHPRQAAVLQFTNPSR